MTIIKDGKKEMEKALYYEKIIQKITNNQKRANIFCPGKEITLGMKKNKKNLLKR